MCAELLGSKRFDNALKALEMLREMQLYVDVHILREQALTWELVAG
jgi:hypothetical protein